LKCGNATLLVTKLMAMGEAVMKANSAWLLLIRGYNAHFSKWTNMVGAVLEHEGQLPHRAFDQAQ
jgi:hypothetical protein